MTKCKFDEAWRGKCGTEAVDGDYCASHAQIAGDAARYRWLRDTNGSSNRCPAGDDYEVCGVVESIYVEIGNGTAVALTGQGLDAAIDAARAKEKP